LGWTSPSHLGQTRSGQAGLTDGLTDLFLFFSLSYAETGPARPIWSLTQPNAMLINLDITCRMNFACSGHMGDEEEEEE